MRVSASITCRLEHQSSSLLVQEMKTARLAEFAVYETKTVRMHSGVLPSRTNHIAALFRRADETAIPNIEARSNDAVRTVGYGGRNWLHCYADQGLAHYDRYRQ